MGTDYGKSGTRSFVGTDVPCLVARAADPVEEPGYGANFNWWAGKVGIVLNHGIESPFVFVPYKPDPKSGQLNPTKRIGLMN